MLRGVVRLLVGINFPDLRAAMLRLLCHMTLAAQRDKDDAQGGAASGSGASAAERRKQAEEEDSHQAELRWQAEEARLRRELEAWRWNASRCEYARVAAVPNRR